ncbi:MAG: hypothetical protein SP4CHLAM5_02690 [Chlamydiia bacterium]|nr:hypothetical protein [Chlamydiia bacterium]MCH9618143.1 hypothetical protein [Chlamydiia bacterium]MCH9624023.1 hypothetical protein [Chlamydiia bacterium]
MILTIFSPSNKGGETFDSQTNQKKEGKSPLDKRVSKLKEYKGYLQAILPAFEEIEKVMPVMSQWREKIERGVLSELEVHHCEVRFKSKLVRALNITRQWYMRKCNAIAKESSVQVLFRKKQGEAKKHCLRLTSKLLRFIPNVLVIGIEDIHPAKNLLLEIGEEYLFFEGVLKRDLFALFQSRLNAYSGGHSYKDIIDMLNSVFQKMATIQRFRVTDGELSKWNQDIKLLKTKSIELEKVSKDIFDPKQSVAYNLDLLRRLNALKNSVDRLMFQQRFIQYSRV